MGTAIEPAVIEQATFNLTAPSSEPQDKWERLLQIAIERQAGAEQFAMLVDSILKARREEARLSYQAAMGRFKANLPEVMKTKKVSYPNKDGSTTTYFHAELDKCAVVIGEALLKEGLSHSWRPSEGENGRVVMTCVFTHHASGHSEDVATIGGPPDSSGGKNSVQAIGSTSFYLERYTLLAGAGIVPKGADTDGAAPLSENAVERIKDIRGAASLPDAKERYTNAYKEADADKDITAKKAYIDAWEDMKKKFAKKGVA